MRASAMDPSRMPKKTMPVMVANMVMMISVLVLGEMSPYPTDSMVMSIQYAPPSHLHAGGGTYSSDVNEPLHISAPSWRITDLMAAPTEQMLRIQPVRKQ